MQLNVQVLSGSDTLHSDWLVRPTAGGTDWDVCGGHCGTVWLTTKFSQSVTLVQMFLWHNPSWLDRWTSAGSNWQVHSDVKSWTSSSMASCSVLSWSRTWRLPTSSELRSDVDRWKISSTGHDSQIFFLNDIVRFEVKNVVDAVLLLCVGGYLVWPGWETWKEHSGP